MKEYDLLRSSVNARTPFSFPGPSIKLRNPGFFSLVQLRNCYIASRLMRNPGVFSLVQLRDDFSSILQRLLPYHIILLSFSYLAFPIHRYGSNDPATGDPKYRTQKRKPKGSITAEYSIVSPSFPSPSLFFLWILYIVVLHIL